MTTVEIHLREAKALIEKGWIQGRYAIAEDGELADIFGAARPPVAFCAEGALAAACGDWGGAANRLAEFVCHILPSDTAGWDTAASGKLLDWNDAPGRTQAEVLAAFDRAIAIAEQPRAAPVEAVAETREEEESK